MGKKLNRRLLASVVSLDGKVSPACLADGSGAPQSHDGRPYLWVERGNHEVRVRKFFGRTAPSTNVDFGRFSVPGENGANYGYKGFMMPLLRSQSPLLPPVLPEPGAELSRMLEVLRKV